MAPQAVESWCPLSVTKTLSFTPCATFPGGSISYCPEASAYASTTTTRVYGTPCSTPATIVISTTIEPPGTTTATIFVPTFTPSSPTVTVTTTFVPPTPPPVTVTTISTAQCTTCIDIATTTPNPPTTTSSWPTSTPSGSCQSYSGAQTWGSCEYYVFCNYFVDGTVIYSTQADNLQECLTSCNHVNECNFVSWAPYPKTSPEGSQADNCFLRIDANDTTPSPDAWGAQKLWCPGDTTTASPTNPWKTTSTPATISTPACTSTPAATSTPSRCPQGVCSSTWTSVTTSTTTYKPPPPPTTTTRTSTPCPPSICMQTQTTITTTTWGSTGPAPATLTSIVTIWSTTGTTTSTVSVTITRTPRALRNNAPRFRLRTHVTFGKSDPFNNLYIHVPVNMFVPSYPILDSNKTSAAVFYYDTSSTSIDMSCQNSNAFSGLTMFQDSDMNELGPVFLQNAVGTARMFFRGGELLWANDRFGSWVACMVPIQDHDPRNPQYRYQLMWWDVVTNMGIDTNWCAKVQLLPEKASSDAC